MPLRPLLTVTAVVMMLFGSGFILVPEQVFSLYGVSLDASGAMLAHVAGAAVLSLGLLAWLTRQAEKAAARTALVALLCFFLLKTTVTVLAQLGGVFNMLGWSIVALDALLLLGYAAALLARLRPAATAPA